MKKLTLLSAFVIALVFSPCVNADLALRFSLDGTSFSDTFNMNVGDSLTVQVYALEIGETRLSDSGLQNFGTKAEYSINFGNVTDASINSANFSDPGGSGFDNGATPPVLNLKGLTFSPDANKDSQILLGQFTFDASSAGTTAFTFQDFNASQDNFVLGDGTTSLDIDFFGASFTDTYTANIVASAVPEPASLGLVVVGLVGLVARRRKQ